MTDRLGEHAGEEPGGAPPDVALRSACRWCPHPCLRGVLGHTQPAAVQHQEWCGVRAGGAPDVSARNCWPHALLA
jgi:hypothetical protein